jgi:hypothetical protein
VDSPRRPVAKGWQIVKHKAGRDDRPSYFTTGVARKFQKGLLGSNDCCMVATVSEDLTLIQARSCLRRFLATPLHEIIAS